MVCLITGVAGFIGFHVARTLLEQGNTVIGIDNLNDYYASSLKNARCQLLQEQFSNFRFYKADITDRQAIADIFDRHSDIHYILHLAAQAGVRYSLENPYSYIQTNVMGHLTLLEQARALPDLKRIFYASSSSVYGLNTSLPFGEQDRVDRPSSVYAASKRSGELLSFTYTHLYGLKQTGLRFFTVYGPWGRPDMAYYSFANAIQQGKPITLYKGGNLSRDFTYIDDVVSAMMGLMDCRDLPDHEVYNIGNSRQEPVGRLISCLETYLQKPAIIHYIDRPGTDIEATLSDIRAIQERTGWVPKTDLDTGIRAFVNWYQHFNSVQF